MTLEDLENALPNGLHDAELQRITIDYKLRTVALEISVWVGQIDDPPERREAYKNGRVDISGLLFIVIEPPDPSYPFSNAELTIDGCDMRKNLRNKLVKTLPADAFFRSLWVNQWNAFIHVAAKDAKIFWLNEGAITYRPS